MFRLEAIVFCICTQPGTKEISCYWNATTKPYFCNILSQDFTLKIQAQWKNSWEYI